MKPPISILDPVPTKARVEILENLAEKAFGTFNFKFGEVTLPAEFEITTL